MLHVIRYCKDRQEVSICHFANVCIFFLCWPWNALNDLEQAFNVTHCTRISSQQYNFTFLSKRPLYVRAWRRHWPLIIWAQVTTVRRNILTKFELSTILCFSIMSLGQMVHIYGREYGGFDLQIWSVKVMHYWSSYGIFTTLRCLFTPSRPARCKPGTN